MRYIDYKAMKDFYIIAEVCELFEVNMQKLRQYSEQYDVQPQQDQMGRWGFSKVHVRKLHNTIYKAERGCCKNDNRQGKGAVGMKTILTVKQVAELLQVSIPQVRRMIANGELSAMKVGREWRVPKAALEELFERELL